MIMANSFLLLSGKVRIQNISFVLVWNLAAFLFKRNPSDVLQKGPPYLGVPPDLDIYRSRGHRRFAAKTYEAKCATCIWGCNVPVEIIVDHWDLSKKKYRFETFCYGPKSCPFYRAGAIRKVSG